jgi:hypothetical protein
MLRSHAICRELLEVTNGMKKLSDELQIWTQSPVQEKEKQNDKSNYNQVFQTASSAIGSSSSLSSAHRRLLQCRPCAAAG